MRDSKQNTAVQNLDEKVVCGDVCGVCHVLCFLFSDGKRKKKQNLIILQELVEVDSICIA